MRVPAYWRPRLQEFWGTVILLVIVGLVVSLVVCAVLALISTYQNTIPGWLAAHGTYPTRHLTYTVPRGWNTIAFTGLNPSGDGAWWSAFNDSVTALAPTLVTCHSLPCDDGQQLAGARIDLKSANGGGQHSIGEWYQTWAQAVTRKYGSANLTMPGADYTHLTVSGQEAMCAANIAGHDLLPPRPAPSPHFNAYFPPHGSFGEEAVIMCFALWGGRAYFWEAVVQLHSPSQASDLHEAIQLLDSLRFV